MRFSYMLGSSLAALSVAGCSGGADEARGVDRNETLLSVSASGEADMRPDEARFEAGVENWAPNAQAASRATQADIQKIVAALKELGVAEDDIQTSAMNVRRLDYGDRRGQFQAYNTLRVRLRDVDLAGRAVSAVTSVGANIVSGPELRISDPEAAANTAYANAYANARKRAEAYAGAAGMEIARVLYIRDGGGSQGNRYLGSAQATAMDAMSATRRPPPPPPPPPPPMAPPPPGIVAPEQQAEAMTILPGQTSSTVSVQVDFALREK